jgi:hypothetical protein
MPSLAALAMAWLTDVPTAAVVCVVIASVVLRPIHTGPILRSALVLVGLSPAMPRVFELATRAEAWVSGTWTAIGGLPHFWVRWPAYALFAAVAFVGTVFLQGLLAVVVFAPLFALIERESLARQRRRDRTAAEIARAIQDGQASRPFSLYLRPFDTAGNLSSNLVASPDGDVGNIQTDFEAILAGAFPAHRPLIALGTPGRLLSTHPKGWTFWPIDRTWDIPGTGKVRSTEEGWRDAVTRLAHAAEMIVVVPLDFPGTMWEVQLLHEQGLLAKCVFVMPISVGGDRDYATAWRSVMPHLSQAGIDPPPYRRSGGLFFMEGRSWRSLPSFVTAPVPRTFVLLMLFAHIRRRLRRRPRVVATA